MIVDSYEIYDNLNLVEDAVRVNIVNSLFTSTRPDWNEQDDTDPTFILNKPRKTSAFENDGSGRGHQYVEDDQISGFNNVNDIKIKYPASAASSILENKVATVDLTGLVDNETILQTTGRFVATALRDATGLISMTDIRNKVTKELKTGSQSVYKVLSDNNYSDSSKAKVDMLLLNGSGDRALLDNGTYGEVNKVMSVNGVSPVNKNITLTATNITYSGALSVSGALDRAVMYNSTVDKTIQFDNSTKILSRLSNGTSIKLISTLTNNSNLFEIGDNKIDINISSKARPTVKYIDNNTEKNESIAFVSDLETRVSVKPNGVDYLINNNKIDSIYLPTELERGLEYNVIDVSNAEASVSMQPNIYNIVQGTPTSVVINYNNIRQNRMDTYYLEFTTPETVPAGFLTLPSGTVILDGFDPTSLLADKVYVLEFRNNLLKASYER